MSALEQLQEAVRQAGALGGSLRLPVEAAQTLMREAALPDWDALAEAAGALLVYDGRGIILTSTAALEMEAAR